MTSTIQTSAWRDRAVLDALNCSGSEYSNPTDVLLSAIRTNMRGAFTLYVPGDVMRLSLFLQTECTRVSPMLSSRHVGVNYRGDFTESIRWDVVEFRGTTLEVTVTPGAQSAHGILIAGYSEDNVRALSAAWSSFTVKPHGRTLVHSHGWQPAKDIDDVIETMSWDDIVLAPSLIADLRRTIDGFFQHRSAFEALGFPWRRGVLLVGPPGTGKTLVSRAVAAQLKTLPFLYVRDLQGAEYGKNPISAIFERARKLAPCILSFEDIDSFINDANRGVFLNELDGFVANTGILVLASSNHPERIDEALLKRPSRFDRVFHLGLPAEPERREYAIRLLSRGTLASRILPELDKEQLAAQIAKDSDGFTPAYLKEVFLAGALSLAQQGVEVLGQAYATECKEQLRLLREQMRKTRDASALGEMDSQEIGFRK
jgi:hypothetical protein